MENSCPSMKFYRLAKGARFEFLGRRFMKIAISMAEDENGNGNVFEGSTVPIRLLPVPEG